MRAALTVALLMLGASSRSDAIDYVALCQSSVQGTKIWISSTIDVYRKDLSAKLNDVDIPPYCECFHRKLREGLGDDLYERSRSFADPLSPAELRQTSEEDRKAVIACVETQVGDRNTPSGPQTGTRIAHQDEYLRFVRSTVTPGSGIGGLRLGDSKAAMFDVLGPTKTFKPLPDGGEQYYYGPNVIEVIISISPPPARAVRRIELSSQFQGQTPGGGRMGDPRDKIKKTYPGKLAVDLPGYVVYCDGTTFLFRDGRLDSIRLADLDSDVFKNDRLTRCSR
jgi:hypothetical protein